MIIESNPQMSPEEGVLQLGREIVAAQCEPETNEEFSARLDEIFEGLIHDPNEPYEKN